MASQNPEQAQTLSKKEKEFYDKFQEYSGYKRSIFMIGITGAGKSTFCNFLANDKLFDEGCGFISKTQQAGACKFSFNSEDVLIIDCPGFCDSKRSPEDIQDELCRVGVMAKDGTDAVAIVVNSMERFSDNHRNVLNQLEFLGGSLWEHAFLVFTRESKLIKEFEVGRGEEYIELISADKNCPPILSEWLKKANRRYVCVESKKKFQNEAYRDEKCNKIFELMDDIRITTNNTRYNNSMMKQGASFFRQIAEARRKEDGMQKLAIQMEHQKNEDKKIIEEAQRKLEETQKSANEKNERDMMVIGQKQNEIMEMNRKMEHERKENKKITEDAQRKLEDAQRKLEETQKAANEKHERDMMMNEQKQNEIMEMNRKMEMNRIESEMQQYKLRVEKLECERLQEIEIRKLKESSREAAESVSGNESSSCFSHQTKIMLSTGELSDIINIKSGDIVFTPNGSRKVAVLSMIKRYNDKIYTIDNRDFQFNKFHPFVAYQTTNTEQTSFAVIDVNEFINFMPTMAARNIKSLYARDTKLSGYSKQGLCPIPIQSISKSEEDLSSEYDILYDVILEPNGTGINEYFAGDVNQVFLVSSEISMYTLESERKIMPAHITILSIINKISQQQAVYSSKMLNTENDVINFFENEIIQDDGISLLTEASLKMSHFQSLNLTSIPVTIKEIEKHLKQTLSFFAEPKPIAVTTLSLIYEDFQTLIGPLHTMIKLGWREYTPAGEREQLSVGIADIAFISEECFSLPIEIMLTKNTDEVPYMMQERENNQNARIRQIVDTIYIPFDETRDDKLYLVVKEKNTPNIIARKCIILNPNKVYDYRLLKLFSCDHFNISEVRVNLDIRTVSNKQMKREITAKQEWNEDLELDFAERFASKIVDCLVQKVKAL
ncbi:hypothetical protein LOD99_15641 [Oopsacas minuta]|uniref:AIG1-type G domain-containing protein n=1 Tax=Oopsacas minuta TaxID=111878 RepID=A0AAV7KAT2_9METZ|nr:hypothetical protein LOD99_15641 [Oopsacas minuta]